MKNSIKRETNRSLAFSTHTCGYSGAIFTVRNVVAARLCFHRHLSFCSRMCVYPNMHWDRHPLSRHTPPLGRYSPEQTPPGRHPRWTKKPLCSDTPLRRPLQRTVRILLECILVFLKNHIPKNFALRHLSRFCYFSSFFNPHKKF